MYVLYYRLSDPIEFIRRPSGLGLGAVPAPPDLMDHKKKRKKNKIKLPGDVERKVGVVTSRGGRGQCLHIIMYNFYLRKGVILHNQFSSACMCSNVCYSVKCSMRPPNFGIQPAE